MRSDLSDKSCGAVIVPPDNAVKEIADLLLTTIASLLWILWVASLVPLLLISTLISTLWWSTISLHAEVAGCLLCP